MVSFGWSHLVFLFPFFQLLYQSFGNGMVSPSLSCSKVFFQFSSKVQVLISLFAFLQFHSMVCQDGKVHYSAGSLFFVVPELVIRLYLILQDGFRVVDIQLFRMVKFRFLAQFPGIPLPPCRVSPYSLSANLLHSLIMWLVVSSLSPHNLYLLSNCVLSILALI